MIIKDQHILESERLSLRPWKDSDAAGLFSMASDPEIGPLAGWTPHRSIQESLDVIKAFLSNDRTFCITLKSTSEVIGCIRYYLPEESNIGIGENDAEVGYWIGRPYWNKGYASEALSFFVQYCFQEKGFRALWGDCLDGNLSSEKVLTRCGFRDTGKINTKSLISHGEEKLVHVWRLDNNNK